MRCNTPHQRRGAPLIRGPSRGGGSRFCEAALRAASRPGHECQSCLLVLATHSARVLQLTSAPKRRGRMPPQERGREDRVRAAPAVSCANCTKENAHEHTGSAEAVRPSLRNGFTAYFVLSPVTGLCCHRHPREALASRELDASNGASGPHDFAVRLTPFVHAREHMTTPSRPPHPAPNVRDDHDTPLLGGTGRETKGR
jgi:hypothetical protein